MDWRSVRTYERILWGHEDDAGPLGPDALTEEDLDALSAAMAEGASIDEAFALLGEREDGGA